MKQQTPAVFALIAINVLFFVGTYMVPNQLDNMLDLFALHFPENELFRVWQFVSHIFMHGSFGHILFNMFGLFVFGGALERLWGARRFLIFYFVAGIGAGLIYTAVNLYEFASIQEQLAASGASSSQVTELLTTGAVDRDVLSGTSQEQLADFFRLFHGTVVGASGAIYGVLVAFALLFPNAKLALIFLPVPVAAKYFVPALLLLDLFSGVTGISFFGGGIAHFAHIGGAIIGFALMMYWRKSLARPQPPVNEWQDR